MRGWDPAGWAGWGRGTSARAECKDPGFAAEVGRPGGPGLGQGPGAEEPGGCVGLGAGHQRPEEQGAGNDQGWE